MKLQSHTGAGPIASLALGLALVTASASAETPASSDVAATCMSAISAHEGGLVMPDASMAAMEQVTNLTEQFRAVYGSAERAADCFRNGLKREMNTRKRVALRNGMKDAGRILDAAQVQFSEALEALSGEVLSDMEPAAGGDGAPVAQDSAFDGMELLFDSYMVLENAQELSKRLSR